MSLKNEYSEKPSANTDVKNSRGVNDNNYYKGYEKRDTYHDLARELKKLWNKKAMIIIIIIDALGTVTKGLIP